MTTQPIGPLLHAFFADHLVALKGLRPASVRSYRDTLRLLLHFVATEKRCKLTRLVIEDLTFERILAFLRHLENQRGNAVSTRNQRLAAIHTFFEFLAGRGPEAIALCQRVAAIPTKRVAPPETRFLERDEIATLFKSLPDQGRSALRDRAVLLFLYNTGARVQEVADLRQEDLDLNEHPRVRLHGKGDKWRTCPLWEETCRLLKLLLAQSGRHGEGQAAVFTAPGGRALTRFGIYKLVRRHTALLGGWGRGKGKPISPHVFRHTAAVHLLESGVEVNVIRGWLGHADLTTTYRYAEINTRIKQEALRACEPPDSAATFPRKPVWRTDAALLEWLASL